MRKEIKTDRFLEGIQIRQRIIKEATGVDIIKPVCYSAEYGWNFSRVFDMIIDHMPKERRNAPWM